MRAPFFLPVWPMRPHTPHSGRFFPHRAIPATSPAAPLPLHPMRSAPATAASRSFRCRTHFLGQSPPHCIPIPAFSTKMIPIHAARSATRGRPPLRLGIRFGNSGSIRFHSVSLTSGFGIFPHRPHFLTLPRGFVRNAKSRGRQSKGRRPSFGGSPPSNRRYLSAQLPVISLYTASRSSSTSWYPLFR